MPESCVIRGRAAAIRVDNLDTDQIMPKQFLRGIDKSGLAAGLLHDLRFDDAGTPIPGFVLNQPRYSGTSILLGGFNFGCGSSREHAVWGLLQYGIRAVIAPSFAEIFYSNAMCNRLLLVQLPATQVEALMAASERPDGLEVVLDVQARTVRPVGGEAMAFPISDRHRQMVLDASDEIGWSLQHRGAIVDFAQERWQQQPWLEAIAARMKPG